MESDPLDDPRVQGVIAAVRVMYGEPLATIIKQFAAGATGEGAEDSEQPPLPSPPATGAS